MIEKLLRLVVVVAASALVSSAPRAQGDPGINPELAPAPSPDDRVKAAFLYNFAKFAKWPNESFPEAETPLRLCILGKDSFGAALGSLESKSVQRRRLEIVRPGEAEDLGTCQVLFVSASEEARMGEIIEAVRDEPVLTVGEMPAFARSGGVINLKTVADKVRFEINVDAARRAGLKISSKLLRLGEILRDEPRTETN